MRKFLLLAIAVFSLFLVACTKQNSSKLEGSWYVVNYKGEAELGLEIRNGKGRMHEPASDVAIIEIDEDARHITVSDSGFNSVLVYDYVSNDEMELDTYAVSGLDFRYTYYRENSQALKDAIAEANK